MDLNFFSDPGLAPKARNEIEIESLLVRPYPDGRRLQIDLHITPFLPNDRPNIVVTIMDSYGKILASANIIETVQYSFKITLHLPHGFDSNELTLQADLYFSEEAPQASLTQQVLLKKTDI